MGEPKEYHESWRRGAIHALIGALVIGCGAALGFKGLGIFLGAIGALLLAAAAWSSARKALGRVDRLVLTDDSLAYVNPVRPAEDRKVQLAEIQEVTIGPGMVGKVKELQVTVKFKDGRKWNFGERFMEERLLREFYSDANERLSKVV